MDTGKRTVGQGFKPPPAEVWNGMVEAGDEFRRTRKLGRGTGGDQVLNFGHLVKLKNDSGGSLVAGRVLEIGSKLLDEVNRTKLWFNGTTPSPDGDDNIAVTLFPMSANSINLCAVSGLCYCRLNVNHVQHPYCDVNSSSTLLQSKWHGRGRILWKSTTSTGEQDAVILLGPMFHGPIYGSASSGITLGGSASVAVYRGASAASPSSTETVHFKWMDGGSTNVPTNGEIMFGWNEYNQRYELWQGECAH